jgi:hypothetical protein
MHFYLLHCASTLNCRPNVIFEILVQYVFVWILSGTEIWSRPTRQMRISRISPFFLDRTTYSWCYFCYSTWILLLRMEEENALKEPGLAIVGTRRACPI